MLSVDGAVLTMSVRDEGIGIPPDRLDAIFEKFSQIEGEGVSPASETGLGIGLALVKSLTELHGGTVAARSPGLRQGSEFIVQLPIVLPSDPAEPQPDAVSVPTGHRRILVADDNEDATPSIAMLLELSGHEVRVALSGLGAVSLAQTFRPDVPLLDIGMPDLNGYEVARQLLQLDGGRAVRLIALTGWGQGADKAQDLAAGFDLYLSKPVDFNHLEALLREGPVAAG